MKLSDEMKPGRKYYYNHASGDMTNVVEKTHTKIKLETLYRYGKPVNKTFTYYSFDKWVKSTR